MALKPKDCVLDRMTEAYIAGVCQSLEHLDYVVYVLRSQADPNLVYCGMTNNIKRRLRQHNGHIKGGGQYTSANRPWHLAALIPIDGGNTLDAKSIALQVEYWTKAKNYPSQRQNMLDYVCPASSEIPTIDPMERRVWLIRETIRRHRCPTIIWFDAEFSTAYNKLLER